MVCRLQDRLRAAEEARARAADVLLAHDELRRQECSRRTISSQFGRSCVVALLQHAEDERARAGVSTLAQVLADREAVAHQEAQASGTRVCLSICRPREVTCHQGKQKLWSFGPFGRGQTYRYSYRCWYREADQRP